MIAPWIYDISIISSGVGRGSGIKAGDRGEIAMGDWLEECRRNGLRVLVREMGEERTFALNQRIEGLSESRSIVPSNSFSESGVQDAVFLLG